MRTTWARGLASGAAMAVTAAGATMIASSLDRGSPWSGLNAMAAAASGGRRRAFPRFELEVTPVGLAVLAGVLLAGGLLYQGAVTAARRLGSRGARDGSRWSDEEVAAVQRPPADS